MPSDFFAIITTMRILLLGSTGLLGRNVLNLLLEESHEVVTLVRNGHGIKEIANNNLIIVEGSLTDEKCIVKAARGCNAVINCAGTTDMSLLHYEDYLPMNAGLCRTLIKIAETTDTKIIVHVSSANTIGYGTANQPGDEQQPAREPFASSFYTRSKLEGEKEIEEGAKRLPGCHLVILNPGFMIGAWDSKPSSGQLLLAGYKKPIMVTPSGGKSFVSVADVARAAVAALTKGRNGERYLLTGEDMTIYDFYKRQSTICGYRQLLLRLPQWLTAAAGKVGDILRSLKIGTQLSTNNVKQLSVVEYYSSQKAADELDYKPTPIDNAIMDFFSWREERKNTKARIKAF